ncbi:hypothetical protein VL2_gp093 [Pseudomonas phage vB_PaeM_VL12]|uniref:Uncharacterized protein n=12 Tax=Nankokuvirus TaxID=1925779 RepID=A0A218L421_9CAUD|nr:hypothetical protein [Pseudomonas aeruginosa]YP_004306812.1 thymidylate synthase [Pseudomonas phage KPP10]YP_008856943.1 thymidylate synthase [Pseudomonas phage PAK_P5]YP_008857701.1 thymidylate synthase [Pseudomonas phage PAK_P3]YP_008858090.1 thymidylate synthase [Pseudomonas phage CHA_P1]YP_009206078.1 thymidylate synthase [Pseudomonas phage vB_PaeM_PS24]YP_009604744.1 thymidylate synthase [Pseudomonas phage vB_PaeM_G1]ADX32075.1 hypothetical protein P3_CHA0066 [Pseudomonas phage P3_CH
MSQGKVEFSLSVSDLRLVTGFKEAFAAYQAGNPKVLAALLYRNGMDTTQPYEVVHREHRNLRGQHISGERFEGYERLDESWIKKGAPSEEAIIASAKDGSLRDELIHMGRRLNPAQAMVDFLNE